MDKQYLKDLDEAYKIQMKEIEENIEKDVRAKFQEELDKTKSSNTQSTYWNGQGSRFSSYQQMEKNQQNTYAANEARMTGIEKRIQKQKEERSQKAAELMDQDVFEDFGGSREAAFEQLKQYEEERKEEVKGKAKDQFIKEAIEKPKKLEAEKGKAQWGFDVASGSQQQKQEDIQGKAQDAFQEASQEEEKNKKMAAREKEEITVKIKTPEKERQATTLDSYYWKQAEQSEAQFKDTTTQVTASKESAYDAQMSSIISKSFDGAKSQDQSQSY